MQVTSQRPSDHLAAGLVILVVLMIVATGFARTYFFHGLIFAPLPSILVHVHAILFVGWPLLVLCQILLAGRGWLGWHQ